MQFKEGTDYTLISEEEYESLVNLRSREQSASLIIFNDQERKTKHGTLYLKIHNGKSHVEIKTMLKSLRDFHYPTHDYFGENINNGN